MSGEIIAIVAVGVALAGVIFAWKTSQKNGELSVEMEKRIRGASGIRKSFQCHYGCGSGGTVRTREIGYSEGDALSLRESMPGRAYRVGGAIPSGEPHLRRVKK